MRREVVRLAKAHGVTVVRVPGGKDDPTIELLAPDGKVFGANGTHSLLCFDWTDAAGRLEAEAQFLEPCPDGCDCGGSRWDLGREEVVVQSARLSNDRRTVELELADMRPAMQMRIKYDLQGQDGADVRGEIESTVHATADAAASDPSHTR